MKILEESKVNFDKLQTELWNALIECCINDLQYEDEKEVIDYLMPVVEVNETSDGRVKAEVRAEAGYGTMNKIIKVLDKVVAKYDEYAYFEPEMSGIINAYLDI